MTSSVGMHDIGVFARQADILQLIWTITDTDICVYFFPTPNRRDRWVSSVVEFIYSVILHTLTVLPCRHKFKAYSETEKGKKKKNTSAYIKHVIFIYDSCF